MTDRTIIPMPGNRAPRRGSHIPDPAAAFAGDLEARLRSDAPDLYAGLSKRLTGKPRHVRMTWFSWLADDAREVLSEIRESPVSHLLVAIAAVTLWTALICAPLLIGEWF
jgi:hypothetical protein